MILHMGRAKGQPNSAKLDIALKFHRVKQRTENNFYDIRVGFDKNPDNPEIDSICHRIVRCRDMIIYLGSPACYTCRKSLLKCFPTKVVSKNKK